MPCTPWTRGARRGFCQTGWAHQSWWTLSRLRKGCSSLSCTHERAHTVEHGARCACLRTLVALPAQCNLVTHVCAGAEGDFPPDDGVHPKKDDGKVVYSYSALRPFIIMSRCVCARACSVLIGCASCCIPGLKLGKSAVDSPNTSSKVEKKEPFNGLQAWLHIPQFPTPSLSMENPLAGFRKPVRHLVPSMYP